MILSPSSGTETDEKMLKYIHRNMHNSTNLRFDYDSITYCSINFLQSAQFLAISCQEATGIPLAFKFCTNPCPKFICGRPRLRGASHQDVKKFLGNRCSPIRATCPAQRSCLVLKMSSNVLSPSRFS